ncbi:MAG: hypothetical protein Q9209_006619 [Squamulea sp. 1 TL-2023]
MALELSARARTAIGVKATTRAVLLFLVCQLNGGVPHDADVPVDAGNYEQNLDHFDYDLNVTRCSETRTYCPNNNFSFSNSTCCDRNQGVPEINYQNAEVIPTAKAELSSYYALAGFTIPTDGVYKAAISSTSTSSTSTTSSSSSTATVASATTSSGTGPTAVSVTTPAPSSGLSIGAKAGIGAGIAAGVLIVAATAIFLWIRRRKNLKTERETPAMSSYLQYGGGTPPRHERAMGRYYKSSELPGEGERTELDSQSYEAGIKTPSEMPG